jgi:hypothetical protein
MKAHGESWKLMGNAVFIFLLVVSRKPLNGSSWSWYCKCALNFAEFNFALYRSISRFPSLPANVIISKIGSSRICAGAAADNNARMFWLLPFQHFFYFYLSMGLGRDQVHYYFGNLLAYCITPG